jgi:hypothetical protein
LGDNRDNSEDSRYRGPISRDLIFGKATMIYWSINEKAENTEQQIRWERVFSKLK